MFHSKLRDICHICSAPSLVLARYAPYVHEPTSSLALALHPLLISVYILMFCHHTDSLSSFVIVLHIRACDLDIVVARNSHQVQQVVQMVMEVWLVCDVVFAKPYCRHTLIMITA